jgi:hypothetical protein
MCAGYRSCDATTLLQAAVKLAATSGQDFTNQLVRETARYKPLILTRGTQVRRLLQLLLLQQPRPLTAVQSTHADAWHSAY